MKMGKVLKRISILLVLVMACVTILSTVSLGYTWDLNRFDGKSDSDLDAKTENILGAIISVVRIVGTGIAIIMLTAVAIKYMSSAPGERAEIKKHAVVYVVGALVLFATTGILGIIQSFSNNI